MSGDMERISKAQETAARGLIKAAVEFVNVSPANELADAEAFKRALYAGEATVTIECTLYRGAIRVLVTWPAADMDMHELIALHPGEQQRFNS